MSATIKLHYKPVVLLLSGDTEASAAVSADYRAASLLRLRDNTIYPQHSTMKIVVIVRI